ncbi:DNA polymerase III subunit alpha [Haloferula sp. A504]|uniref:DNA polymerase III subunit alpha n=1 Tax=Haloferula sp. A504 TaxID=3373601 RepID=UPI0031CA23BA|nr:DNA polymerase III subunit alpha [Verrucomicrobiaceae bacterium E54]
MFVELHARSAFSFLRGASLPEALVERAAELGYPAIAVTDHLGFQGSPRAHAATRQHGIRALVGTTLEVPSEKFQAPNPAPAVVALAANRTGYTQLCQHLTEEGERRHPAGSIRRPAECLQPPRREATHSPWNLALRTWHFDRGAVAALTGDRDHLLCRLLLQEKRREAESFARQLIDIFGLENVHIQLTRHHLRDDTRLNRLLIDLADHLKLPLIASNSPLHATRTDRLLCDAFTCLRHHTTLDQAGALLAPNGERHLKSPRAMRELFRDLPAAIDNTLRLAERLDFTLENLGYRFPDACDDTGHPLSIGEQSTRLRRLTYAGAHRRYGTLRPRVKHQLEHELALIHKLGFPGYFLIVEEIMSFAKAHGIFCQGRGSAANSAVCYALGITNVDPVGGGLLFERFLSENRRSWPDIDIDFPSGDRRELVIQHVFKKYGPRGAAMTANVITYRPRSAFREMSKVLGFPPQIADRFSDLCSSPKVHDERTADYEIGTPTPGEAANSPTSHSALDTRYSAAGGTGGMDHYYPKAKVLDLEATMVAAGIPKNHPRLPALTHLYHAVLSLPRHLGQHSGGMIICDRGLDRIVPLQPATMPGRTIVQWDKDDCEDLGIVKVDLLGLGMLAALETSLKICADRGHPVDPALIPKNDPAVYEMLCRADTIGTFQVESRAQMATLPIMRPQNFYDLAIEVAIIRPGPIVGDLVHPYLNRRNGREPVDHIHPDLEPILARTLGVPLFQEQVLRMAMTLAGFTGTEADELRRAMAFKRADEKMEAVARKLDTRMTARGIPAEARRKVIQSIGSFALYGFPESHAISFALIAYLSCWMKVHHPAEFYCGLINHQPMGFYSVNTLLQDAKRHRVRARPISVIHSSYETTVLDDHHLRLGLHRLKGLSKKTARRLLAEREMQPFTNLPDFLRRVRPGKNERRVLAATGALNELPEIEHRRHALWQSELPLHDDLFAEVSLRRQGYGGQASSKFQVPKRPDAPGSVSSTDHSPLGVMADHECLAADLTLTGATTGPHPMALWRSAQGAPIMKSASSTPGAKRRTKPLITDHRSLITPPHRAIDLHSLQHAAAVRVAGMVICRQRPSTAKGHCFISLEDETGIANLFVPRDTFQRYRLLITTESFLLAEGTLQISEGDQPTLYTTALHPLPGITHDHAAGSHDFR